MGDGEGSIEGYRQGIVLALDRNPSSNVAVNIWIRNLSWTFGTVFPGAVPPDCGRTRMVGS